jgi:hypothetical protein
MEFLDFLDDEQLEVIEAILHTRTRADAASALGISERTLYRRLQDEELKTALRLIREARAKALTDRLLTEVDEAANTLIEIHSNKANEPPARSLAAYRILTLALKARETEDVAERLEALEERYREGSPTP